MKTKTTKTQFWIHQHYDEIKHWLIVVIGFVLVVFAMLSYSNQSRLLDKVATLSQQNKKLSQDNKVLNSQSKSYAIDTQQVVLQNRANLQCLAKVFAQYTQDFVPITIDNLESCSIKKTDTSSNTVPKTQSPLTSSSGPSSNNTPSAPTVQSDSPHAPATSTSSPPATPVEVLGLPVCVPLTKLCITE